MSPRPSRFAAARAGPVAARFQPAIDLSRPNRPTGRTQPSLTGAHSGVIGCAIEGDAIKIPQRRAILRSLWDRERIPPELLAGAPQGLQQVTVGGSGTHSSPMPPSAVQPRPIPQSRQKRRSSVMNRANGAKRKQTNSKAMNTAQPAVETFFRNTGRCVLPQ